MSDTEQTPLISIRKEEKSRGNTSASQALATILRANIGAGILSIPNGFWTGGLICSVITTFFGCLLSIYCTHLLIDVKNLLGIRKCSYGKLGQRCLGHKGKVLTDIILTVTQAGFCCSYMIFMNRTAHCLLKPDHPDEALFSGSRAELFAISTLILWPFVLFRSMKFQAIMAHVGNFAMIFGLLAVLVKGGQQLTTLSHIPSEFLYVKWSGVPVMIPMAIFCFAGVGLVLPVESSMKRPELFGRVINVGQTLNMLFILTFGVICCLAFGTALIAPQSVITANLRDDALTKTVMIGFIVSLFFACPVVLIPVFEVLERVLNLSNASNAEDDDDDDEVVESVNSINKTDVEVARRHVDDIDSPPERRNGNGFRVAVLRSVVMLICGMVAFSVPHFGLFIGLIGALTLSALAFTLPALFHWIVVRRLVKSGREHELRGKNATVTLWIDACIVVIGLLIMVVCTTIVMKELVQSYEGKDNEPQQCFMNTTAFEHVY